MPVGFVLLAWSVVGIKDIGVIEATVTISCPTDAARFAYHCTDLEGLAFADLAFFLHLDVGDSVELDGHMVTESLTFLVGDSEGQCDSLIRQVLFAWGINGVENVVLVEAAIAVSCPKEALIADGVGIHLCCHLANILVSTSVAVESEVAYWEDDVVNPHMVAASGAAAILLVSPSEHMFALVDRDDHLLPASVAIPLLDFCVIDIEL